MHASKKKPEEILELLFEELADFAVRATADFKSVREEFDPWYPTFRVGLNINEQES